MKIVKTIAGHLLLSLEPKDRPWKMKTLKDNSYQSLNHFKQEFEAVNLNYHEAGEAPVTCWGGPAITDNEGNAWGFMPYAYELECHTLAKQGVVVFKLAS